MEINPTLEAVPAAAALDPVSAESLPALVVGERADVSREHGWPASIFYVLSYLAAVGLGAGALGCVATGVFTANPKLAGVGLLLALGSAVQWRLATEVEHFSHWGWYGAMVELAAASLAKVWAMAQGNVVGGAIGLAIDLLWMSYFWEHRDQFDVDLDF